jgi:peptidase E
MADDIKTCADERSVITYVNGMPTIMVEGLNIVQGKVNMHPHYLEKGAGGPSIGGGSEAELKNYAIEDPTRVILGIRNGAALLIKGRTIYVTGEGDGVDVIRADQETIRIQPGAPILRPTV